MRFRIRAALLSTLIASQNLNAAGGKPIEEKDVEERYRSLETLARGLYYLENLYVEQKLRKKNTFRS